jgi:hypothetical protein
MTETVGQKKFQLRPPFRLHFSRLMVDRKDTKKKLSQAVGDRGEIIDLPCVQFPERTADSAGRGTTIMNCQETREVLLEYQHGQLSRDVREGVAEHLGTCSLCSLQFQQQQQIEAELDRVSEIEPSPYFDQKLNAKLDELLKPPATWNSRLFCWLQDRYALTFVLLLLTTLGTWAGFRHQQAQKLKSMKDVLEVQERYLGNAQVQPGETENLAPAGTGEPSSGSQAKNGFSAAQEEAIPEGDLAVLENYELLQDYDLLKNFDIVDLRDKGSQRSNLN